jgi:hypothetical protein
MFELHVVVAAVVMLNILELTMEIVPIYPTMPWAVSFGLEAMIFPSSFL